MNRVVRLLVIGGALGVAAVAAAQQSDETPPPPTPVAPVAAGPAATTTNSPSYSTTVAEANTKLGAVLPPNMSQKEACSGFTSLQLCAATLHASQNLGIPFPDLKTKVANGETIEAAIRTLRPEADARAEMMKARQQAMNDMRG
jgi:hypothetical protein